MPWWRLECPQNACQCVNLRFIDNACDARSRLPHRRQSLPTHLFSRPAFNSSCGAAHPPPACPTSGTKTGSAPHTDLTVLKKDKSLTALRRPLPATLWHGLPCYSSKRDLPMAPCCAWHLRVPTRVKEAHAYHLANLFWYKWPCPACSTSAMHA